jgi:hypothetical protein
MDKTGKSQAGSIGATLRKWGVAAFLIVFVIVALPILVPMLALYWLYRVIEEMMLSTRVNNTWPHGKTVLVAYTNSAAWRPYIEGDLLPRIGAAAVVVNRSLPDWKIKFPLERTMLRVWGGDLRANPVVIVRAGRFKVRVFNLYDAFRAAQHGKPEELARTVDEILALSQE